MFVWKVGRAKTFSLIVVTTDGEVGLHVGAERAEMGRLSRQEAMMAAQTAFSPDPHKWELFSNKFPLFPPSLSHAAEAHQLVRSQSAVNILINVNTLYNRTWTDWNTSVSGSMFCCYCLYPRNEILSLLWFLLEKLFFFCWKSSWNIRPKTFCLPKYFGVMYTLPWNCPEEEKILEIFSGRGRSNFFRAGQGSVESFTGLGKSGHPFPGQDVCACASLI